MGQWVIEILNTKGVNEMDGECINKATGEVYTARFEKISGSWLIGGDKPEYAKMHYIVFSKGIEYTLKNGRLIRA